MGRWASLACVLALLPACESGGIQVQEYRILRTFPHDDQAYTQGLVYHGGYLYESTGRHGSSSVRKVNPETGEVLQITRLAEDRFGEGLARVGSELYQLTWKAGQAFVYDLDSLAVQRTFDYEGDGWGLCFDGQVLFMSDGTSRLQRRDPSTFEILDALPVTEDGFSVSQLNELECVGDHLYANIYMTDRIVRIDKATGHVVAELDGFRLSAASRRTPDPEAVLNGIAYNPDTETFYLTGKLWPDLFEVELVGG